MRSNESTSVFPETDDMQAERMEDAFSQRHDVAAAALLRQHHGPLSSPLHKRRQQRDSNPNMLRLFTRTLPKTTTSATLRTPFLPRTTYNFASNMAPGKANTDELKGSKLFDVSHLTAIVTGGGTGIGLMITQALVANGAKVYITSRREEVLKKTEELYSGGGPGQIIPLVGDVRYVFLPPFTKLPQKLKPPLATKPTSSGSTTKSAQRNQKASNSSSTTQASRVTTRPSSRLPASQTGMTRRPSQHTSSSRRRSRGPRRSRPTSAASSTCP
jgi:hypothetical protein